MLEISKTTTATDIEAGDTVTYIITDLLSAAYTRDSTASAYDLQIIGFPAVRVDSCQGRFSTSSGERDGRRGILLASGTSFAGNGLMPTGSTETCAVRVRFGFAVRGTPRQYFRWCVSLGWDRSDCGDDWPRERSSASRHSTTRGRDTVTYVGAPSGIVLGVVSGGDGFGHRTRVDLPLDQDPHADDLRSSNKVTTFLGQKFSRQYEQRLPTRASMMPWERPRTKEMARAAARPHYPEQLLRQRDVSRGHRSRISRRR